MHLKAYTYVDNQGLGCEAFRMLIPSDWEFEGGVQWPMNNPGMPGVIAFQVRSPSGVEAFEVLPNLAFCWSNSPMVTMSFPVGSFYFGSEVRAPAPAGQVLREIVLPRYRGHTPGLQIVGEESLPDLPAQLQAGSPAVASGPTSSDGAKVRVRYRQGEKTIEEEIYGVVEMARTVTLSFMGMVENILWQAAYLFSFRAQAGHLDALADLFGAIVRSFRLNPQWYNRYMQLSQYMIQNQIQQIHHIGQISQIISQTSDQISDMITSSYNQRQETLDRVATSHSQAIRGVDEYQDPISGGSVELPGGYRYAWANALDEYIVSDDPSFDPNLRSNLDWQPMSRQ